MARQRASVEGNSLGTPMAKRNAIKPPTPMKKAKKKRGK